MSAGSLEAEEMQVIDDELIMNALTVHEKHTSASPTVIADTAAETTSLCLSFRSIREIANLQGFNRLQKLCVDNNFIKEIKNLDHLVNLTWLDLSFNCIERISGLQTLRQLRDLSLFNNVIDQIEGLASCEKLQCLSLGNNKICALDRVVKLRRFKQLRLLNLEGNPVSREGEYRMYVLAYLNDLTYLDYSLVSKAEITGAREQYQDELLDVEEKEALEDEKAAREAAAAKTTSALRQANLAIVETIFDDMFAEDTEMTKLKHLPGIGDISNSFQSEVESASDIFLQAGMARHEHKSREISLFEAAVRKMRLKYASESVSLIENFVRVKKKKLKHAVSNRTDSDMKTLLALLSDLSHDLMDLELRQADQFEDLMGEFEVKYFDLKSSCLEAQQVFFRVVEEHENNYTRDLMQLVNELLEKAARDELPSEISDEASSLLVDRDACMNAIAGSHDIHVGRLYKLEDEVKNHEEMVSKLSTRKYRDEEHKRSRDRVMELSELEKAFANDLSEGFNEISPR